MNSKFLKKSVLFFSLLLVSVILMYSFKTAENLTANKGITISKTVNPDRNTSAKSFDINNIAKCGGSSKAVKSSNKKSKCGAGKCGEGKCGAGKCGDGKSESKKHSIMDADTNGDGKVSLKEFSASATEEFPNKDKNHDGKLSSDECGMFDKFNTNGDDYVSKEEFAKGHTMVFNKLDKNHDGFITAEESKAFNKCGDGKCGGGKCGDGSKAKEKKSEGKCGAGKCGGGK